MFRGKQCMNRVLPVLRYLGRRTRSSISPSLASGDKILGYTVEQCVAVPELSLTALKLRHDNTGAQHLHVARDDDNNVFGVALRTTPHDSTGVPHILEHTTLCESQNFPVRDPFFKMLTRSLNTFMNAFTAADWTMYPFSTQNAQDYNNLLSVYLDSVFFPKLSQLDFYQEGWRLEHENPQDKGSPVVFKGVVYNEMKGVFSDPQSVFGQANQNHLLPNHTYGVVSGGDPEAITDLTWEQLRQFHQAHYHPSNARFYTYGNIPVENHLEQIEKFVLNKFQQEDVNTSVPLQPRWSEPKEVTITCRPDPMAADPNKQTTVAVSYLLTDVCDTWEQFVLGVLGSLLVDGDKAPFYTALLEPNIGSDYAPTTGYSNYTRDSTFSVGLQGIHVDDVSRVRNIIDNTIDTVLQEGFESESIDAVLHKLELSLKHQSTNFGLHLGISVIASWNHDGDPVDCMQASKYIERLRQELRDNPAFLKDKIKQYMKENTHKLTLVMSPSEGYEELKKEREEDRLQRHLSQLTAEDKETIYQTGLQLLEAQTAEQDPSVLPSLAISDIPKELTPVKTYSYHTDGVDVQYSEQPTNDVAYFHALYDLRDLTDDLLPYAPLFSNIVTKMGAGVMDYRELGQQVELKTGGLSAVVHVSDHHTDPDVYQQGLLFSSYALNQNVEAMFDLWTEIFNRVDLSDTGRLETLIRMEASELAMGLANRGHAYAMGHAAGTLHPSAHLKEMWSGMSQVSLMKVIAEMKDMHQIVHILREIAHHVLNKSRMRCSLNCTPEFAPIAQQHTEKFIHTLHGDFAKMTPPEKGRFESHGTCSHFVLPFSVNFLGRSCKTVPYVHEDYAKLVVLARLLTWKYLHSEIREKGGAYGGGASCSPGFFNFYSYRDPNLDKTMTAFDQSVDWAISSKFTDLDIDEAKLAVFAQVDAPVSPGNRGQREFLSGITDSMKQRHREQLFSVTKKDLSTVAEKYLSNTVCQSTTLLGPENTLTSEDNRWIKHTH